MSYQKQNFANGEVLTAQQLNHIENGIADVESKVDANAATIGAWTDDHGQTTIAEVVNDLTVITNDTRTAAESAMADARKATIKAGEATAAIGDWEDEHPEQTISECVTSIENGIADVESTANATKGVVDKIIDHTLSLSGKAADAKATGDAVRGVRNDLATEITRAKKAEKTNADNLSSEITRAQDAEQANADAITAEASRAKLAEQTLDTRTAALESCGFVVQNGKVCIKYRKS